MDDDDAVCSVCSGGDSLVNDVIVICELCSVPVHQSCYGIPVVPEGDLPWYCSRCTAGLSEDSLECVFCLHTGGAMKPMEEGGQWAHLICAFCDPDFYLPDPKTMEPIVMREQPLAARKRLQCRVCRRPGGLCIQCDWANCAAGLHATCARKGGSLRMGVECARLLREAYCPAHAANSVAPLALLAPLRAACARSPAAVLAAGGSAATVALAAAAAAHAAAGLDDVEARRARSQYTHPQSFARDVRAALSSVMGIDEAKAEFEAGFRRLRQCFDRSAVHGDGDNATRTKAKDRRGSGGRRLSGASSGGGGSGGGAGSGGGTGGEEEGDREGSSGVDSDWEGRKSKAVGRRQSSSKGKGKKAALAATATAAPAAAAAAAAAGAAAAAAASGSAKAGSKKRPRLASAAATTKELRRAVSNAQQDLSTSLLPQQAWSAPLSPGSSSDSGASASGSSSFFSSLRVPQFGGSSSVGSAVPVSSDSGDDAVPSLIAAVPVKGGLAGTSGSGSGWDYNNKVASTSGLASSSGLASGSGSGLASGSGWGGQGLAGPPLSPIIEREPLDMTMMPPPSPALDLAPPWSKASYEMALSSGDAPGYFASALFGSESLSPAAGVMVPETAAVQTSAFAGIPDCCGSGGASSTGRPPLSWSSAVEAAAAAAAAGGATAAAAAAVPGKGGKPGKRECISAQGLCCICACGPGPANGQILTCGGCQIPVHKSCYGVTSTARKHTDWLCCRCQDGAEAWVACCLCGASGGAMKLTSSNSWVHIFCVLLAPIASRFENDAEVANGIVPCGQQGWEGVDGSSRSSGGKGGGGSSDSSAADGLYRSLLLSIDGRIILSGSGSPGGGHADGTFPHTGEPNGSRSRNAVRARTSAGARTSTSSSASAGASTSYVEGPCCVCGVVRGLRLTCRWDGCRDVVHPVCARSAGFLRVRQALDGYGIELFCCRHSDKRASGAEVLAAVRAAVDAAAAAAPCGSPALSPAQQRLQSVEAGLAAGAYASAAAFEQAMGSVLAVAGREGAGGNGEDCGVRVLLRVFKHTWVKA